MPRSRSLAREEAGLARQPHPTPTLPAVRLLPFFLSLAKSAMSEDASSDNTTGSKSTSEERPADFRFLNFSNPQEAKNAQTRKSVRSHVTTGQHRNARKAAAAENAKRSKKGSQTPSAGVSDIDTDSPEAASPVNPPTPTQLQRINPLELYPATWHSSLDPIMVSRLRASYPYTR
jgi:hypothetical protein